MRCCNELVIANTLFQASCHHTVVKAMVPLRITNNLNDFDSRIAVRGHRNKVVTWEHIDTITNGCIEHD